ncbi:negative elongation factor E-like [Pomacea canaliculata]|uniref:negative elongation factor E-like n=1 Tax=Pomacea canaliculata TaxID=400727 RepID=UPI000D727D14|nr:negative elongation factor E-like [Pomacea canaliculata]
MNLYVRRQRDIFHTMVYITFPSTLTEEEETLKQKYAKLRKKRKALQALKTAKPESLQKNAEQSAKRSAESAEEATEQAKKLVQSGAIKVGSGSREKKGFKRSKNLEKKLRETDKSVGFLPFDSSHSGEEDEKTESIKPKMKGLYESFTPAGSSDYDGESRRSGPSRRDREPPAKGHTVFVHGHGVTEDIIRKHFSNFGNIVNVSIEREKNNAFVTFEKMESADQAIANANGSMMSDILLRVSMAIRQANI